MRLPSFAFALASVALHGSLAWLAFSLPPLHVQDADAGATIEIGFELAAEAFKPPTPLGLGGASAGEERPRGMRASEARGAAPSADVEGPLRSRGDAPRERRSARREDLAAILGAMQSALADQGAQSALSALHAGDLASSTRYTEDVLRPRGLDVIGAGRGAGCSGPDCPDGLVGEGLGGIGALGARHVPHVEPRRRPGPCCAPPLHICLPDACPPHRWHDQPHVQIDVREAAGGLSATEVHRSIRRAPRQHLRACLDAEVSRPWRSGSFVISALVGPDGRVTSYTAPHGGWEGIDCVAAHIDEARFDRAASSTLVTFLVRHVPARPRPATFALTP